MAEYSFFNIDTGLSVAQRIHVASNSSERRRGLLGVQNLDQQSGLWISPCEAIHTFGMKMRIDVMFLDRALRIRKLLVDVGPRRMAVCLAAYSVVEMASGTLAKSQTKTGHQLRAQPAHGDPPVSIEQSIR